MFTSQIERLRECYFSQPEREVSLAKGEVLLKQNGDNHRLYYVLDGELEGFYEESLEHRIKIFNAQEGAFIGVHSFFSGNWRASATVIAKTPATLGWIDRSTKAVDQENYGPVSAQFTPVIVDELARRQRRATEESLKKERALEKMHSAEQMATLGQLAAGIAHELNNAIGVVHSKSERLEKAILHLLEEVHPEASQFFDTGLIEGEKLASKQVRSRAKQIEQKYKLGLPIARELARAQPNGELTSDWFNEPEQSIRFWQLGRDLHDLRLASQHTVGIVKSVKQLGRADIDTRDKVNINESIQRSLALLHSDLRGISVRVRPGEIPLMEASPTELVQVWVNLIKNAVDALSEHTNPEIEIQTRFNKQRILVTLANNGPEIDETTRRKIFQPNFSTKKGGLSFGLGLGLSIVRRIVSGYGGSVAVKSDAQKTIFRIRLPIDKQ